MIIGFDVVLVWCAKCTKEPLTWLTCALHTLGVQRLTTRWSEDPAAYVVITDLVAAEKRAGEHGRSTSCAKGLLWLTRCAPSQCHVAAVLTVPASRLRATVAVNTVAAATRA